jgi:uncharacterized protein (DUF58 family)
MTPTRELRIATLVVAPLLAAISTLTARNEQILHRAAPALLILWMIMACAIVLRPHREARDAGARGDTDDSVDELADDVAVDHRSMWSQLDVLTATGTAMMWAGTLALVAAGLTGWASLSVVGVLGLGTVYLAAIWTVLVAGGGSPWRGATVARTILPEVAVEGDPLREELHLAGVRIPAGMRLFATGRALPHGVTTRYTLAATASLAEIKLESELGSAPRGEHRVPPLTLWLGDALGLTRTPAVQRGAARVSVLPRPTAVDGVRALVGPGRDDASARPTQRQPSEGVFRIRTYVPGDDTRRIHWVRSLQMNQLVMRLPDEVPPAEPAVRLVLDSDLWGTESLSCRAPDELLDALVRVWLGIGKSLAELGVRVTLVTAAPHNGTSSVTERPMLARSPRDALRLGARVAWQTAVPLAQLMARDPVRQIVVSGRPRRIKASPAVSWVVVPEVAWTSRELWSPKPTTLSVKLPFPSGSAENRFGRRMRERRRLETVWHDRTIFSQVMCWSDWTAFSGDYVARPSQGHVSLVVIP